MSRCMMIEGSQIWIHITEQIYANLRSQAHEQGYEVMLPVTQELHNSMTILSESFASLQSKAFTREIPWMTMLASILLSIIQFCPKICDLSPSHCQLRRITDPASLPVTATTRCRFTSILGHLILADRTCLLINWAWPCRCLSCQFRQISQEPYLFHKHEFQDAPGRNTEYEDTGRISECEDAWRISGYEDAWRISGYENAWRISLECVLL
jgi:hypothetical protein